MSNRYCFVVPCFQHSGTLEKVLGALSAHSHKIFVVDDGSAPDHQREIARICGRFPGLVELIRLDNNQGKGGAVSAGLWAAWEQGFSHACQVDSDGQHDLSKIRDLFDVSRTFPHSVVSGQPKYDAQVPKSRLYGRYITHFWVWIETLSFEIKDSMCGFRIYPLEATISVLRSSRIGMRMDFDVEVLVRLFWSGCSFRFVEVSVSYPEGGLSHFDVLRDNLRISKMHAKLFFGMLPRIPVLLWRKLRTDHAGRPWHTIEEQGTLLGMRVLLFLYRFIGRAFLNIVLVPVSFYYSSVPAAPRGASKRYRALLAKYTNGNKGHFSSFSHVHSFARAALDKFSVWMGDIRYHDLNPEDVAQLVSISHPNGAFFLSSHYGNIEICRSLGRQTKIQFNALVYLENAKKFNSLLSRVNPESRLNLISVQNAGPELSMLLREKLDQGEWVFVMGDRLSIKDRNRTIPVTLLGERAHLPEGPFLLAYLLEAPIYVIHCFRQGKEFRIRTRKILLPEERNRANRKNLIQRIADEYAAELERLVLNDPTQWYNFFDFWQVRA